MTTYVYKIKETKRNGYIAWDAIDETSGDSFPVNAREPYKAGTFPEISDHLKDKYGVNFKVSYLNSSLDSLDDTTWTYKRDNGTVVVYDIPRTIFRMEVSSR
jgi:hypothetical protein